MSYYGNLTTYKSQGILELFGDPILIYCNDAIDYIRRKYGWHIYVIINPRIEVGGVWAWESYSINDSHKRLYAPKNEETFEAAQRVAVEMTLEALAKEAEELAERRKHQEQMKSGECITRKEAEGIIEKALTAAKMQGMNGETCEYVMKECKELLYYTTE